MFFLVKSYEIICSEWGQTWQEVENRSIEAGNIGCGGQNEWTEEQRRKEGSWIRFLNSGGAFFSANDKRWSELFVPSACLTLWLGEN